jgi:hypothetical protein
MIVVHDSRENMIIWHDSGGMMVENMIVVHDSGA